MLEKIWDIVSCAIACTVGLASEWYTWNSLTKMITKNIATYTGALSLN